MVNNDAIGILEITAKACQGDRIGRTRRPGATVDDRFTRAIAAIDAVNAGDPTLVPTPDGPRPKELHHATLMTEWVRRLRPDADEALLLAARGHHIKRWSVPRASYAPGRTAYLRWRTHLHEVHAEELGRILADAGYEAATIERVQRIVRKDALRTDPDTQTLEDALCLVFLGEQLEAYAGRLPDEKMVDVLRKSWTKMSAQGREFALTLDLGPAGSELVRRALAG
jgi:hypothetical protein